MVVTWSDLAKHCPWSKGQPIGNGIYCAPWHSASSYCCTCPGSGLTRNMRRIAVFADSRAETKHSSLRAEIVRQNFTNSYIEAYSHPGTGISAMNRYVSSHLDSYPGDIIIFMAGICDVTKRLPNTKKFTSPYRPTSAGQMTQHIISLYQESNDSLKHRFPQSKVRPIYAQLVGISLSLKSQGLRQMWGHGSQPPGLSQPSNSGHQQVLGCNK